MPYIDFTDVNDARNFLSIPEGRYLCRVADIRNHRTTEGDERWFFRLEVVDGDYAGRTAAWDGMTFSEKGNSRAKFVLEQLGFDVGQPIDVSPTDLLGREAMVEIQSEQYDDPNGQRRIRGRVPFLGYERADAPL